MRFFKNVLIITTLCSLQNLAAKQVTKQSSPNIQPQPQPSFAKAMEGKPTQPSYTPMPQEEYTRIFTMLQTTQPSTADHTMLMKIKNEVDNQIRKITTTPTQTVPNQQPSTSQQQFKSNRLAQHYAETHSDVWDSRDQYWLEEVWDSLTEEEKLELYNKKPSYVRWLAANASTPLTEKLKQWLTKNKISFETEKI